MRMAELRAAIQRARDEGEHDRLTQLQAEYRTLPLTIRRELLTAERVDERSCRRSIVDPARQRARAARAVSRATPEPGAAGDPQLYGHFCVFNVWSEIESLWEGNFMESLAPGSAATTIKNDAAQMRITFNHGRDPYLGNKVLAAIEILKEDATGVYYEAQTLRGIPDLLLEGLRADQYGASMRFYVMAEEYVEKPKPSAYNPRGIPERTLTEILVEEFGPVTFPQYPEATAQLRSRSTQRVKPTAAGSRSREIAHRGRDRDTWIRSL